MNSCKIFVFGLFFLLVAVSTKAEVIVENDEPEESFTQVRNPFHDFLAPLETETKICRYRDKIYPRNIWNYITGYYCYNFTNEFRLNFKYNWTTTKLDSGEVIPVGVLPDGKTYVYYDYVNGSLDLIEASFRSHDFFELWRDCCREAVICCDDYMTNENIYPNEEYCCPVIWDAWTCFPHAKRNTISKLRCSKQAYSNTADLCILDSEKQCLDSDWNQQTNYNTCAIAPVYRNRHQFHVILLSIGLALSVPAVLIFVSFQKFRNTTRVVLHRNLISVVIVRNMLTIMVKELVLLDALNSTGNRVMEKNSVACRVLAFFESAAKNGIYACMLADGFYLHKLIVRTFAPEPNIYIIYGIVAALTFGPTLIWAGTRASNGADQCWMVDTGTDQLVSDGFRMAILAINFLLLFDIVRCMIVKRKSSNLTKQMKETFRATLFLIPLFGLHILIITNRNIFGTSGGTCSKEDIYYYISYSIEGMQSVLVALTFCYLNTEVHSELKNAYRKFWLHLEQRYGWNLRSSSNQNNLDRRRRTTAATYIDPVENPRYQQDAKKEVKIRSIFDVNKEDYNNETEL